MILFDKLILIMKESKLVIDNRIESSIEVGLKVLQFATEYNIRTAYYRNCPLNFYSGSAEKSNIKKNQRQSPFDQIGDLLTQLNSQIQQSPKKQIQININRPLGSSRKLKPSQHEQKKQNRPSSKRQKSNPSILDGSKDSQSDSSVANADQCSDYHSEESINRLASICEQQERDPDTLQNVKERSNLPKGQNKKHHQVQHEIINHSISNTSQKSKKKPKIQTVKKTKEKSSQTPVKQHLASSLKNVSPSIQAVSQFLVSQLAQSIAAKTNNLDKSFSKIEVSCIQVSKDNSLADRTQIQLMKQLSSSFQAAQSLQALMKLQNYEIKQKWLQMRLNSRFQKAFGYSRKVIGDISWDSLQLPQMTCAFKRPSYALMTQ